MRRVVADRPQNPASVPLVADIKTVFRQPFNLLVDWEPGFAVLHREPLRKENQPAPHGNGLIMIGRSSHGWLYDLLRTVPDARSLRSWREILGNEELHAADKGRSCGIDPAAKASAA